MEGGGREECLEETWRVTFPGVSSAVSYDGVGGYTGVYYIMSFLLCLSYIHSDVYDLFHRSFKSRVCADQWSESESLWTFTVPRSHICFLTCFGMPTLIHAGR